VLHVLLVCCSANGGATVKVEVKQENITAMMPVKKKRDRFNGMTEEEVLQRTLPDHLVPGLDIIIVRCISLFCLAYSE